MTAPHSPDTPDTPDGNALVDAIETKAAASRPRDHLVARLATLATWGGVLVVLLGGTVIVGWVAGLPVLTRLSSGLASMKPTTATALLLLGASVVLTVRAGERGRRWIRAAVTVVGVYAAAVALEYLTGASFGVDNPFGFDHDPLSDHPGRMSLVTSLALLSLVVSLTLMTAGRVLAAQCAAIGCNTLATMTLIGYLYGVESLYDFGPFSTVALHTAAGLWVASAALLAARAGEGMMSLLVGNTAGGIIVRRLLPVALVMPVLAGGVAVAGIEQGWFDGTVAITLFVTLVSGLGGTQVWWQASRLRHVDLRRAGAEEAFAIARTALRSRDEAEARLRRANADLADFSAAMAHDLRSPLTVVAGYTELLQGEGTGAEQASEWVDRIAEAAERGAALIADILAFSAIGGRGVRRQPVDLATLLAEVVEHERAASGRGDSVEVAPGLPVVVGDEALLRQLFSNLVGNALKYVPSGRRPLVLVDAVGDAENVVLRVTDNGDPIADDEHERIFEMFQRGGDEAATSGSGVGLAICRRIAELHDGWVWVEPVPDGVRFCVSLPAASHDPA